MEASLFWIFRPAYQPVETYGKVGVGKTECWGNMAVGQLYQFGVGVPPILVYFSGDSDVHLGVRDFDPWRYRKSGCLAAVWHSNWSDVAIASCDGASFPTSPSLSPQVPGQMRPYIGHTNPQVWRANGCAVQCLSGCNDCRKIACSKAVVATRTLFRMGCFPASNWLKAPLSQRQGGTAWP